MAEVQETKPLNAALVTGEVPQIQLRSTSSDDAVLTRSEIQELVDAGGANEGIVKAVVGGYGASVDSADPAYPIINTEVNKLDLDGKADVTINTRSVRVGTVGYFTSDRSDPTP